MASKINGEVNGHGHGHGATSKVAKSIGDRFTKEILRYKIDVPDPTYIRIAKVLMRAYEVAPGQFVPLSLLTRVVHVMGRTPRSDNEMVDTVRSAMSRARDWSRVQKKPFTIVVVQGLGVRAAVDDEDILRTRVRQSARRHASTGRTLAVEAGLVDDSKVKDPVLRPWLRNEVRPAIHALENKLKGLLGPAQEDGSEK